MEVKHSQGYLVPLVAGRMQLTFTAMGSRDGSTVTIQDSKQEKILDRSLRAGESVSVSLNDRGTAAAPWLLDAYSDGSGYLRLSITAGADEPLLYGRKLEDVQFIRDQLTRPAANRRK
jgi:hypothetical protein